MTRSEREPSEGAERVELRRVGDWTSWTSIIILALLGVVTWLCLLPFTWVLAQLLPGSITLWNTLYFAAFLILLIPGLQFLQVWLVDRHSRRPNDEEWAALAPLWRNVLRRAGKTRPGRYRLRVVDCDEINAAAGGGCVVLVTTRALSDLHPAELEAVLAHEFGHHVGLHPLVGLAQYWLTVPINWVHRVAVVVHNVAVWIAVRPLHWAVQVFLLLTVVSLRLLAAVLEAVVWLANFISLPLRRQAEYQADAVATRLGYGNELAAALAAIGGPVDYSPVRFTERVSQFFDTHPPTPKRLAKIQRRIGEQLPSVPAPKVAPPNASKRGAGPWRRSSGA